MSFGGGGDSTNNQILEQQKQEAAQAKRDNDDRRRRLAHGRKKIDAIFNGGTVGPYKQWGKQATYGVAPGTPPGVDTTSPTIRKMVGSNTDNQSMQTVKNPYYGKSQTPTKVVTGHTDVLKTRGNERTFSGIGDDFYQGLYDKVTDYYLPQVDEQYGDAKKENLFDLARRGLLRSSVAAEKSADIEKDYFKAKTDVATMATNQKQDLENRSDQARTTLRQQLDAVENPTNTINAAIAEANAIQSSSPDLSGSLGNLFSNTLNAYSNYRDVANARKYANVVQPRSPTYSSGASYS